MAVPVLGTRGSALALWQARWVAARIGEVEEKIISTVGDRDRKPLDAESDRGVFVREIEHALLEGRIDLAVHSLKDLPSSLPEGLRLAAIPRRHDPRDALLTPDGIAVDALPRGARIATGSPRRRAQLLEARPDLTVVPVRGNVDTRVRKLLDGEFDALVLAVAGIDRLGLDAAPWVPLPLEAYVPAAGQGALAVEVRATDETTQALVAALDDPASASCVEAERAFLRVLGGGCLAPIGVHAAADGERVRIVAFVGGTRGRRRLRADAAGDLAEATDVAQGLAQRMLEDGAAELLELARESAGPDAG